MTRKIQISIFIFSIIVHCFYYISAFYSHTLTIVFDHVTTGQDFFQVPNAAYAFFKGGSLTGNLPSDELYIDCCAVNSNVYHPLFTLLIGGTLQLFLPWTSFAVWSGIHIVAPIFLIFFIWQKFRNHRYIYLALAIYLFNAYHYYEIHHAQYHFLLNFFTLFFLIEISKRDSYKGGLLFFLSLLVKPIGLLWIIPFLLYKKNKTVFLGLILFIFSSLPFIIAPVGQYYFKNLYTVATTTIPSYNIFALTFLFPINFTVIKIIQIIVIGGLFSFQLIKKPPIFIIIFLWISYTLIFYNLVFHYHYTILATFFCLGILYNIISVKKPEIIPIIFLTLPTPLFLFRLEYFSFSTVQYLSLGATWSFFWLIILMFIITSRKSIIIK